MRQKTRSCLIAAALMVAFSSAGSSTGAPILGGVYDLHNHPDAARVPPPYGLRLDELYNVDPQDVDRFTFDFDHPLSNARLIYNDIAGTMHIFGSVIGGRDVGDDWANDEYLGMYHFDFWYNTGIAPVPGDDDLWVPNDHLENAGWILTPLGDTKTLTAHVGDVFGFAFRFGDEDDDLGHGDHPGISGWGWMGVDGDVTDSKDWIFTAEYVAIPEPASLATLLLGGLLAFRRSRT